MKKYINKIFVLSLSAIISAGVLMPLSSVQAAAFNNGAQDYPTLRVSNYTKNPGSSVWSSSVSADAGDMISFDLYFHNTGTDTALQTRTSAILPTGNFTSTNVYGSVWAQNAALIGNNVAINLTSSQTLTFVPGSVKWYPDQTMVTQNLLYGQTGAEVVTAAGLNIGDIISAGWTTQGHVVFRAQVSNNFSTSAPAVTTNSATSVASNSAVLNSQVNPNGLSTNTWFEYGTSSTSLNFSTSSQNIGSGSLLSSVNYSVSGLNSNTNYYFRAVAQNSSGTIYGNILSFTTSSGATVFSPVVTTNSATSITLNSAIFNGQVNPNNGSTTAWFEYGTSSTSLTFVTPTQSLGSGNLTVSVSASLNNLSSNTTYYFRAVAQNSSGTSYGNILSFTTSSTGTTVSAPTVTTYSAGSITANSAILNAAINPNNASTNAWFEYGTSSASLSYTTGTQSLGSGSSTLNISANLTSLSSNTTYYFRAVATNSSGTTYGSTLLFATSSVQTNASAPSVTTNSATLVSKNSANLNGTINPNGLLTSAWLEYSTSSSSLGNTTSTQNLGNGNNYLSVTLPASGLAANTTYYFRPVAQNSSGTTYGAINSFATLSSTSTTSTTTNSTTSANTTSTATTSGVITTTAFIDVSQGLTVENLTYPNGSQISNFADIDNQLKYTITLKNIGSQSAYNLKTSIQIPSVFKYLESSPLASYESASNTISWNTARLRSGETASLSFVAEVQGGSNSVVNVQAKAYLPFADLNVFSNSVSTFIGQQKPISMKLTASKNEVKAGDSLEYSVAIKNSNSYLVKNVLLSIGLPQNVELVEADFPVSTRNDNSLIIGLEEIASDQEIIKKLTVKVGNNVKDNDILTVIALVNYQDQAGNIQPIISASVSTFVIGSANLAASIFGGISSFSITDWITLIGALVFVFVASILVRGVMRKMASRSAISAQ